MLEGADNVHGHDSLTTSMLGGGDRVTDDALKEDLKHTMGLLIKETRDMLDIATTSKMVDGGLGDALDVIMKDLSMMLGTYLSKTFASFSMTGHDGLFLSGG